jgi:hypothetical protein
MAVEIHPVLYPRATPSVDGLPALGPREDIMLRARGLWLVSWLVKMIRRRACVGPRAQSR